MQQIHAPKSPIRAFKNHCGPEAAGELGGEGYELSSVCFVKKGGCHPSRPCFQHGRSAYVT